MDVVINSMVNDMSKVATKVAVDGGVEFKFSDGETVVVKLEDLNEVICARAAVHGLTQKLGDSYAGADNLRDAKEKFHAVLESLKDGNWNSGRSNVGGGDLLIAFVEATGKDEADCRELLAGMPAEQKRELRKHKAIVPIILRLSAERQQAKAEKLAKNAADAPSLDSLFN